MMLNPGLRKFALTAHVTPSVGWLGAVARFLAMEIAACDTHTEGRVRSSASRSRVERSLTSSVLATSAPIRYASVAGRANPRRLRAANLWHPS